MEADMRRLVLPALVILIAVPVLAQPPGGDDAAVRAVIRQHDETRNRGDFKALAQLFTADAEQHTSAGEWRRGRAEIEKNVAQIMATTYKGGKYTTKVDTVRMLTPTVAIVDGAFEISNIGGGGRRMGHSTYVLVKDGQQWRIAAVRSMVPTPVGATVKK
jgi:uncharacterized protein (TIGR02246 family)